MTQPEFFGLVEVDFDLGDRHRLRRPEARRRNTHRPERLRLEIDPKRDINDKGRDRQRLPPAADSGRADLDARGRVDPGGHTGAGQLDRHARADRLGV